MVAKFSDKWDELYFLKYDGDSIIDESAEIYAKFFNQVPSDHKITNGESGGGWSSAEEFPFVFSKVSIADKLFIVSHGESNGEIGDGKSADILTRDLKTWGLKKVGLITFKCCNLARGGFLEQFVASCSRRGIIVGWVKGYTGFAITRRSITGNPFEFVRGDHNLPKIGDARFRIVQGNHPTPIQKFERYSYAESEDEQGPEEEVATPESEKKTAAAARGVQVFKGTQPGKSIWDSRLDKKT